MQQTEFRMITDLSAVAPKELRFNYDELKAFLNESLQSYETLVVTEDAIAGAKQTRARLNKLKKDIDGYRLSVKKQLMEQYDSDFKPKCDELTAKVDKSIKNIDAQIKAFEQREADEKIARIREAYDAAKTPEAPGAKEYCPWEAVYNEKWRNKGYAEDDAKEEISLALRKAGQDINTIFSFEEVDRPYLLDFYKSCRDIGETCRKANELKLRRIEAKRMSDEARKRQETENARRANEVILAARGAGQEGVASAASAGKPQATQAARRRVKMCVWGTDEDLMALSAFMKEHGITFEPLE